MKQTALTHIHQGLEAKMVPFAGYLMPLEYTGVRDEHHAVREHVGVFDVSHMGIFWVKGKGAKKLVQKVTSNDVNKLYPGKAHYSCLPNNEGGIVDDLIVYHYGEEKYMLVVNASNLDKDWNWIQSQKSGEVKMDNASDEMSILAVQGPKANDLVQSMTTADVLSLKPFEFLETTVAGIDNVIVAATGYTGSGGLELYFYNDGAETIWNELMENGKPDNIQPIGLAARDTLRLEAGMCLYGNDINDKTTPLEAGLAWITKLSEDNPFVGRDIIQKQKEEGVKRKLVGFEMLERGIPRRGYEIVNGENSVIGEVTSGTMSPTLGKGIGMGYVTIDKANPGTEIGIQIRNKQIKAQVVKLPFYKKK